MNLEGFPGSGRYDEVNVIGYHHDQVKQHGVALEGFSENTQDDAVEFLGRSQEQMTLEGPGGDLESGGT